MKCVGVLMICLVAAAAACGRISFERRPVADRDAAAQDAGDQDGSPIDSGSDDTGPSDSGSGDLDAGDPCERVDAWTCEPWRKPTQMPFVLAFVMELHQILRRVDAPEALAAWAESELLDLEQAWDRCNRGDHRIWLAACGGMPIEKLIDAAAEVLLVVAEELDVSIDRVASTIEAASIGDSSEALLEMAEDCDRIAQEGAGGYREGKSDENASVARGAASLARAAEGLVAGAAVRDASRVDEARGRSVMLGVGIQSMLPRDVGVPRLDVSGDGQGPAQGIFLFCVAACSEAVSEAQVAVVTRGGTVVEAQRHVDRVTSVALTRE